MVRGPRIQDMGYRMLLLNLTTEHGLTGSRLGTLVEMRLRLSTRGARPAARASGVGR